MAPVGRKSCQKHIFNEWNPQTRSMFTYTHQFTSLFLFFRTNETPPPPQVPNRQPIKINLEPVDIPLGTRQTGERHDDQRIYQQLINWLWGRLASGYYWRSVIAFYARYAWLRNAFTRQQWSRFRTSPGNYWPENYYKFGIFNFFIENGRNIRIIFKRITRVNICMDIFCAVGAPFNFITPAAGQHCRLKILLKSPLRMTLQEYSVSGAAPVD